MTVEETEGRREDRGLYSRGYKKHAIDEKMFVTLPIFSDDLDCRLFVFLYRVSSKPTTFCFGLNRN
jgi:hypothetical protein